jgi:glycosyltransferase involved in cell wall biosynthesis
MRIAQIAPLYEAVPPALYGGTERVIAALCDGLTGLGHEVTLFAAATSVTAARLESVGPPLRERMSRHELTEVAPHLHLRMLADVYERAHEFDVIHSHVDVWTLPFAARSATPSVLTMHGRLDTAYVQATMPLYPDVPLVSVSDSQRAPLRHAGLRWAATVHNGLDLGHYHEHPRAGGEHLAFVGRISPEKGPTLAIEVARRTGRPLQMAAKVDPMDVEYFERHVEPLLGGGDVDFVGELDEARKPAFLAGAAATLFPSDWPEPFGLVMIESLAAGTPVVALRRGAVPEVVVDGVTGFICDDVDEMVEAIDRLPELDPDACRARARQFGADAMCEGYDEVYRSIRATRTPATTQLIRTSGAAG